MLSPVRPHRWKAALLGVVLLCASARAGKFDDDEGQSLIPGLKFSGLIDARFYETSRDVSWLRAGSNMLRYGGRDTNSDGTGDRRVAGFAVPQTSVVLDAAVIPNAKVHVQANFSTDSSSASSKIGVIEAFAQADKAFSTGDALQAKAGGFIPLLSWEHPDNAWSTRYTLTPSVIGSWVGEEIRALGAEGAWQRDWPAQTRTRLTAGAFSGGDQIGRSLWFRGWALHDYQGSLTEQYILQQRAYAPSVELDGRLGYYGRGDLSLFDRLIQLGGGWWTNNGNERLGQPGAANLDTQAFRTQLWHYGGKVEWKRVTLIGQLMRATISAIDKLPADWSAGYGLASVQFGKLRLSGRYERFWSVPRQNGHALTAFVGWDFSVRQQLAAEFVYANSRTAQLVRPLPEVDRLAQLNWRLRF